MGKRGPKPKALLDRMFPFLEWQGDCLVWTGGTDEKGYGRVWAPGWDTPLAHRLVWLLHQGDLEEPLLRHACDNPPCCNLEHLVPGDARSNAADMLERHRENPPWRGVTVCKRGHRFTPDNTYITPDGRRNCRRCRRRKY